MTWQQPDQHVLAQSRLCMGGQTFDLSDLCRWTQSIFTTTQAVQQFDTETQNQTNNQTNMGSHVVYPNRVGTLSAQPTKLPETHIAFLTKLKRQCMADRQKPTQTATPHNTGCLTSCLTKVTSINLLGIGTLLKHQTNTRPRSYIYIYIYIWARLKAMACIHFRPSIFAFSRFPSPNQDWIDFFKIIVGIEKIKRNIENCVENGRDWIFSRFGPSGDVHEKTSVWKTSGWKTSFPLRGSSKGCLGTSERGPLARSSSTLSETLSEPQKSAIFFSELRVLLPQITPEGLRHTN